MFNETNPQDRPARESGGGRVTWQAAVRRAIAAGAYVGLVTIAEALDDDIVRMMTLSLKRQDAEAIRSVADIASKAAHFMREVADMVDPPRTGGLN